jgi:hypothetical protein
MANAPVVGPQSQLGGPGRNREVLIEGFRNDLFRDLLNHLTTDKAKEYVNRRRLQIFQGHMGQSCIR